MLWLAFLEGSLQNVYIIIYNYRLFHYFPKSRQFLEVPLVYVG